MLPPDLTMYKRDDDFMDEMDKPEYLYHYTSREGLLGILKNDSLWMTNILYLISVRLIKNYSVRKRILTDN